MAAVGGQWGALTCTRAASPAPATASQVEEPAKRKGGVMVASVAELVHKLKNEAKVL